VRTKLTALGLIASRSNDVRFDERIFMSLCARRCSTYAGWGELWWTVGLQKSHRRGDGVGNTWLIASGEMVGWTAGTFSWVVGLG
jgi:hypothetical protein